MNFEYYHKKTKVVSIITIVSSLINVGLNYLLILRIGRLMSIGYEKTILLHNPSTYDTADIISSYVYRVGLLEQGWSYSTAIGLFNSVINLILLVLANKLSKKLADTSLW